MAKGNFATCPDKFGTTSIPMSCVDGSRVARTFRRRSDQVRYSLVSGLLLRRLWPLALMVSVDRVPICFAGSNTLDICRVVPIPGLTGLPSCRIVLAIVERRCAFERSSRHAVPSVVGRRAR